MSKTTATAAKKPTAAKKAAAPKAPAKKAPTTIRGTIAELVGAVTINGLPVDQPTLSALTRMGIGKKVGTAEKPEGQRGPAPTIWEFTTQPRINVARR